MNEITELIESAPLEGIKYSELDNNSVWVRRSNKYYNDEISDQIEKLPVAVYKVEFDPTAGRLYLAMIQDKFHFPYKIYDVETNFVNRVAKTYKHTTGNLGILLNGVKGTGKTVTAELICNKLEMPVVIVSKPFKEVGLSSFLNDIKQEIIIFFDEYEKTFNDYDHSVLTIMDGVLNTQHRKVFLLTTNNIYLNDNMLQRPGRLRYVKKFEDLSLSSIYEIIDDKLIHLEFRNELIEFISTLEIITVDIVKALVEEVNIHKESPSKFANVFNTRPSKEKFDVQIMDKEGAFKNHMNQIFVTPYPINTTNIGEEIRFNGQYEGNIVSILPNDVVIVEAWDIEGEDPDAKIHKNYKITPSSDRIRHKNFMNLDLAF